MKKIFKWITMICTLAVCFGLMLLPNLKASAEAAVDNGYVYYAQAEDGVLTAYSKTALSGNVQDVVVKQETGKFVVPVEYAFSVTYKNNAEGKIYVELQMDGSAEDLRVVKINGTEIQNLDATFSPEKISLYLDQAGTYAVISVNAEVGGGFAWYHIVLLAGAVASVALCVVAVIRRKKV